MTLSENDREGLGVAFNEATLLGAEIDEASRFAAVTLSVLTLPESGNPPDDPRIQVLLLNVGRAATSLRLGVWNDASAPVVKFAPAELLEHVQQFGGCAVYGWKFFDLDESNFARWHGKLSFDIAYSESDGRRHSLWLSQSGGVDRHLDFCIWFDELRLRDATGRELPLSDVIAGGRRWWDAFHENDPRTQGQGMIPLDGES